jgi:hypothetical protein
MRDGSDQQPRREKGNKEGYRCQQKAAVGTVGNPLMNDMANLCEMQQEQRRCRHQDDEAEQDPGTWDVHESALHE